MPCWSGTSWSGTRSPTCSRRRARSQQARAAQRSSVGCCEARPGAVRLRGHRPARGSVDRADGSVCEQRLGSRRRARRPWVLTRRATGPLGVPAGDGPVRDRRDRGDRPGRPDRPRHDGQRVHLGRRSSRCWSWSAWSARRASTTPIDRGGALGGQRAGRVRAGGLGVAGAPAAGPCTASWTGCRTADGPVTGAALLDASIATWSAAPSRPTPGATTPSSSVRSSASAPSDSDDGG